MRKLFYLLSVLTIFNGLAGAQGGSTCINVTIYCPDEQNFLDSVEAKLLKTISELQTPIQVVNVNPTDGADWRYRLTKNEIKNNQLPKKYLPTYKYQLTIAWDSSNTKGYVFGFSKLYCYDLLEYAFRGYNIESSPGFYLEPFYHVPLGEYKTFLSQKQVSRLYKIIEKSLLNYISKDTGVLTHGFIPTGDTNFACEIYSDTSTLSSLTIDLNKADNFQLMPLALWVSQFKEWAIQREIPCYNDSKCDGKKLTEQEINNIYARGDTVTDEDGNLKVVLEECDVSSIRVAEKWTVDTSTSNKTDFYLPYGFRVKREIKSLGVITHLNDPCTMPTADKCAWLPYNEINYYSWKMGFRYYRIQLDNTLFKKLNLKFRYW